MIGWALIATVAAQDAAERPPVASDLFRPSFDAGPFLVTEVARVEDGAVAGIGMSWAREPLRIVIDGEGAPVVEDAVAVHLGARVGIGPFQVGVTAPGYVVAQVDANRTVLGDPTLDLKLAARTGDVGLGVIARLGASLGASDWQLGYPGPFADIGALGGVELGRVTLTANAGVRVTPEQTLADVVLDDAFWFRGAGSVAVGQRFAPGVEIWGQRSLSGRGSAVAPVEWLAQARYRWASGGALHAGVGTGLTSGVGSPRWRLVVGASFDARRPD